MGDSHESRIQLPELAALLADNRLIPRDAEIVDAFEDAPLDCHCNGPCPHDNDLVVRTRPKERT